MKNKSGNFLSKEKAQDGFTLIELLIVVAIVVIIAAVTLGSLTRSQDQQIFNNSFEKLYSLINTARSLSISGKGQLDYTDFDNDGCRDTVTAVPPCPVPDYVTPANYGVQFNTSGKNVVLFADMNPPTTGAVNGAKGVYNPGTDYATGYDLDLDSMTLPTDITMDIQDSTVAPLLATGSSFFSPNYADLTSNNLNLTTKPYLVLRLNQGVSFCKQIRIHKLAGIPEVELCGTY